ncbi:PspC domain-containing protein [Jatrophihabitans sp.]|uniref:PspC domain-containing protein n=1 Tax=Jatrophihabitans sp. TaxID=1932789 RepID=UPI0030C78577
MTTTEPLGSYTPPAPQRTLRRSRTDRVGAGVAGGLGEYFAVDPVLFRVLFATAAFFGGAGLLGYLLAWAAIPEEGTEHAPVDSWVRGFRQRRIPFLLAAVAAILLFWAVAFSWWAPGPALPVVLIAIVIVLIFGRRRGGGRGWPGAAPADTAAETVSLDKQAPTAPPRQAPEWVSDLRKWAAESREASRNRRRRAQPVRIAGLVTLVTALAVLGLIDGLHGIPIPVYLWVAVGIVGVTLLTGLVLRRTPWSLTSLLVPALIALIGLGGTHASLHDGIGQKQWRPTTHLATHYRLAFGQAILDLRSLPLPTTPEAIDVTVAAGQVRVIMPSSLNVTLRAEVHFGNLNVDGTDYDDGDGARARGVNVDRTVLPAAGAAGAPLLIRVHLADGNVSLEHR